MFKLINFIKKYSLAISCINLFLFFVGDCKHNRANSLAKIQSMAIEAPITQVRKLKMYVLQFKCFFLSQTYLKIENRLVFKYEDSSILNLNFTKVVYIVFGGVIYF